MLTCPLTVVGVTEGDMHENVTVPRPGDVSVALMWQFQPRLGAATSSDTVAPTPEPVTTTLLTSAAWLRGETA